MPADGPTSSGSGSSLSRGLKIWFGQAPRAHGEILQERTVSFLELFYDLVFVVLVGQAAHTLAVHPTWRGVLDFAAVFGLIWIAWINGTLYHELHGREDGRSRSYIFAQMWVLAVLAVFTAYAGGDDGTAFAITYSVLLLLLAWQWFDVRRRDAPEMRGGSGQYLMGLLATVAAMVASAWLDDLPRTLVWVAVVVAWVGAGVWWFVAPRGGLVFFRPTESLVERFGLFIIIVLGETVVGVVNGILDAERDALTITTGVLALTIGFGLWWNYFDVVGRRPPRAEFSRVATWFFTHLPQSGAIAAVGAAMVGLVEHAHDDHTPAGVAWLLGGSVALGLTLIAIQATVVEPTSGAAPRARVVSLTYGAAAIAALACAAASPAPWLLALLLTAILMGTWLVAFVPTLASGSPAAPTGHHPQ